MSQEEFDIWVGLAQKRQHECPSCGKEVREIMDYSVSKQHCPICSHDYYRTERVPEFSLDAIHEQHEREEQELRDKVQAALDSQGA